MKIIQKILNWFRFPGEKILAEGPLEIQVEWFDDEGKSHSDKNYSGAILTRVKRTGWYTIYDKQKNEHYRLNDSHIKKIFWENMATGETGYHKTTNRGRNVLENDVMEAN